MRRRRQTTPDRRRQYGRPGSLTTLLTKPLMQLVDPCLASVLNRRIKEDDLVLYPDFVHYGLQRHMSFQRLSRSSREQASLIHRCRTQTFSSFARLSPLRLLPLSLETTGSRRPSSSTRSNSIQNTEMMWVRRCRRMLSIF